jgi:pantothenate kinase
MSIPATWSKHISSLIGPISLNVAGFDVGVELTADQLVGVYFPLLSKLHETARSGRVLAGLAGVGSGGKSVFTATLAYIANAILPRDEFIAIGMDGWHWPNQILDALTTHGKQGEIIPLRQRKGGPESYDVDGLLMVLRQLQRGDQPVSIQVYDRQRHDPIPDALTITPQARIVLIEGNYLLGGIEGQPEWDQVASLLHPKLFLECDLAVAHERMIERHIRGGATPEEAERKYAQNDQINAEIIRRSAARANYIIQLAPSPRLEIAG